MSRISNAVENISLGRPTYPSPLINVAGKIENVDKGSYEAWRLQLRLGVDIALPLRANTRVLEQVRSDLCCNIVEYVFGEFKQPLLALRKRFYELGDVEGAAQLTTLIEDMFEV